MLFPGMDGVRTFWNKTGSWAGSTHVQIIPTSRVRSFNVIRTHPSPFSEALQTPTNSSTKLQLSIHSGTDDPRDKHLARPCYVGLLAKYKRILSYRKRMTIPAVHTTVRQKKKSLNHTAIISISYATETTEKYLAMFICKFINPL
jgi:hypothetical protein